MGKALVIKNADFSTNALDSIEFLDIHCTGISLVGDTLMLVGDTLNITPTRSPSNCTDAIEWETSDSSIATVDDGEIVCVGAGTVTITAQCGAYSATHQIVCISIDLVLGYTYGLDSGYGAFNKRTIITPTLIKIPAGAKIKTQCTANGYAVGFDAWETTSDYGNTLTYTTAGDGANIFSKRLVDSMFSDKAEHQYNPWNDTTSEDMNVYFTVLSRTDPSAAMTSSDVSNIKAALTVNILHNVVT